MDIPAPMGTICLTAQVGIPDSAQERASERKFIGLVSTYILPPQYSETHGYTVIMLSYHLKRGEKRKNRKSVWYSYLSRLHILSYVIKYSKSPVNTRQKSVIKTNTCVKKTVLKNPTISF